MIASGATFNLSGWLGGYDGQNDNAVLTATFKDASGSILSTATIGPVLATDRGGTSSLLYREATATVPKNAKSVVIQLVMTRVPPGVFNDGYADNLSLILTP